MKNKSRSISHSLLQLVLRLFTIFSIVCLIINAIVISIVYIRNADDNTQGIAFTIAEIVEDDLTTISETKIECIKSLVDNLSADYVIVAPQEGSVAIKIHNETIEYIDVKTIEPPNAEDISHFEFNNVIVIVKSSPMGYIAPTIRGMFYSMCLLPIIVFIFIKIYNVCSMNLFVIPIYTIKRMIEDFNDEYAEFQTISTIPIDSSKVSDNEEFVDLVNELNIFANTLVTCRQEMVDSVYVSEHDALTGLKNRHGFENDSESYRYIASSLGIIFIDLNYLKRCNDTLGHEFGDLLLQTMASIIGKTVTKFDTNESPCIGYRFGGDEYAISFWNCSEADLLGVQSELLRQRDIQNTTQIAEGISLSFAYGYEWTKRADMSSIDVQNLLASADSMMYEMKRKMKVNAKELK